MNSEIVKRVFDFINTLSSNECLKYENTTWNIVTELFKSLLNEPEKREMINKCLDEEFNDFLNENVVEHSTILNKSNKISKIFLILFDSDQELVYKKQLEILMDHLSSCNKYIYMKFHIIEKCFFILNNMLSLTQSKL